METGFVKKLEARISRLAIEVTNTCNARCKFCAYRYMKRRKYILSNEKFKFFLEKYIEYGGGELKLTPIVGDPLVDRDLIAKIRLAKRYKEITYLYTYTNLIGLRNFNIKELLLSGIDKIDISTCIGDGKMYKRLFGVDKYDLVMENLANLVEENDKLGKPVRIDIILRVEKPYRPFDISIYEFFVKRGYIPRAMENWDNWTGLVKEEDLPKGQKFRKIKGMSEPCSLFYKGLIVFPNGDVGACWCRDVEATLIVGNLYKSSLDEIWRGKELKKLREDWWLKHKVPDVCKNCYQYTSLSDFVKEKSRV